MNLRKLYINFALLFASSMLAAEQEMLIDPSYGCCPCPSTNHYFVRADALYWTPRITGLELDFGTSSIVESTSSEGTVFSLEESDLDPQFKWSAGYRVGLGYADNQWKTDLLWTHFDGKGSRHTMATSTIPNAGEVHIQLDQIDFKMGYNFNSCSAFTITPYFGLRAARIREHVQAIVVTPITLTTGDAIEARAFNDKQKYTGVGPLLGINANWDVWNGFGFYGSAAASLLYGEYKLLFRDVDAYSAPFSKVTLSENERHLHAYDCNLDLALGISWNTLVYAYEIDMKLGFEHHQFFNQSLLGAHRGDISFTGGVFSLAAGF